MTNPHPTGSDAMVDWQLAAFDATLDLARKCHMDGLGGSTDLAHLEDMRRRIDETFSRAKLGRWLGWAQCAVVACGCASLDEMKEINRAASEKATALPTPKGKHIEDVYPGEAVVVLPKPDWYSDGFQIKSIPFNHNGLDAVGLYTAGTFVAFLLAAKQQGIAEERERCAGIAAEHAKANWGGPGDGTAALKKTAASIEYFIRGAS